MKLSIVIPTFNEQRTVVELVRSVQRVIYPIDYEIIIIDDASIDRTYEKTTILRLRDKQNNIRIFQNHINKGKSFSIRKGIRHATGDFFVVQDADDEYDPTDIPKLLEPLLKGEADMVCGSRFLGKSHPDGMAFPNWVANKILTGTTNLLYGLHLTDMEGCYKIFKTEMLRKFHLKGERFDFDPEIIALLAKSGAKIVERPIGYNGRTVEKGKKIKARDFFSALLTLTKYKLFHR